MQHVAHTLHASLLHPSLQEPSVLAVVTDKSLEHEVITFVKETIDEVAGVHFLTPMNEDFQVDFDSVLPKTPKAGIAQGQEERPPRRKHLFTGTATVPVFIRN
eukprot:362338-Pleurochrysis_carterae.AAC.2